MARSPLTERADPPAETPRTSLDELSPRRLESARGMRKTYALTVMLSFPMVATRHPIPLQAQLLHGLSDSSRLRILDVLREGERRVSDLVGATGLSQPNVSRHLACLWGCGLVAREKRGREVHYWLIEGVSELLGAVETVLDEAGETVGACSLNEKGECC